MSKKLYFLFSFVLVLSLAGSASAQTFWTDGGGDHLWCNPANWDNGLPEFNPELTSWETRGVDGTINIENMTDPVLIGPGCDAEAAQVLVGVSVNTGPGVALNMTGGTFKLMEIELGQRDGGFGWMTMSGGTVDFVDYCYLAVGSNGGEGRLDMTGGTMNLLGKEFTGSPAVWAGCIRLPKNEGKYEGNDGVGHIQLDGGTINTRILVMADNGTMDITGGTMTIHDDQAMVDFYLGGPNTITDYINDWIADGNLTAYDSAGIVGVVVIPSEDVNEPNEIWIAGRLDLGAAWLPIPYDGAIDILKDVSLSWQPGDYVQSTNGHKVYFADNFTDVDSRAGGAYKGAQTDTTYDAGQLETLVLAKTYYWAIDEVNAATTWPGPVWNFTMDRGVAKNPDPPDGGEDVNSLGVTLSWAPGIDANDVNGHEVYFGTSWGDVNSATTATTGIYRGPDDVLGPDGNDRYSYVIPGGDLPFPLGETYFWRIDEVNGTNTWKGDVWRFDAEGRAKVIYPADGAGNIPALNLTLYWEAGTGAGSHDVYFGTSKADVTDANTANIVLYPTVFRGNQLDVNDPNYPVENLEISRPYFWRIDEVNTGTGTFVEGHVWSFTTGTFLIVDSFEPYRYKNTEDLKDVWKDPLAEPLNDAQIQLYFAKTDANKVIDEQSMEFAYRCEKKSGADYIGSYAAANPADLEIGSTDWTIAGVKALVVHFYGDPFNGKDHNSGWEYDIADGDQMWVALEDSGTNVGIVKLPNMTDIQQASWHTWDISLQDPNFSSVDMNNVAKVYIGFGGEKGGQSRLGAGEKSGKFDTVWFDDIRLYPPRCMPSVMGIDVLSDLGDIVGGEDGGPDCNTNYLDLDIMARDWASIDGQGWTENRPAIFTGGEPNWVTGHIGSGAIEVGDGDEMEVTDPRLLGLTSMTISCWVNRDGAQEAYVGIVTSRELRGDPSFEDSTELAGGKSGDSVGYSWNQIAKTWQFSSGLEVQDANWTFIAVSVDPTGASLYAKDANEAMQTPARQDIELGPLQQFQTQFWIGRGRDDSRYYKGSIDDVRIYGYNLDDANIAMLANETGEPDPPPVYWWKFDDGSGLSASDSGTPIEVYRSNMSLANIVPKDPCDSEDPNLAQFAFDPNNMDIVNFVDYRILAEHWLEQHPWP